MSNTRLALLPLDVSRSAPGPVMVVVAGSVSTNGPSVRVIDWGASNRLEKVSPPRQRALARFTAWRRLSWPGLEPTPSAVMLTTSAPLGRSKAPTSTRPSREATLVEGRNAGAGAPAPKAGLPGSKGIVKVGPP